MKWLSRLFAVALFVFIISFATRYKMIIVEGPSMEPTLMANDYIVCQYYKGDLPTVGDIVIVAPKSGDFKNQLLVKRVQSIPSGKYFVVGDNKENSIDSRSFGSVSEEEILGKVIYRVFPMKNQGQLK